MRQSSEERPNLALQFHLALQQLRTARTIQLAWDLGLIAYLAPSPRTLEELTSALRISPELCTNVLEVLKLLGWVEQYREDYAVSSMTRLIYQAECAESFSSPVYWSRFQNTSSVSQVQEIDTSPEINRIDVEPAPSETAAEEYRFRESLRQWSWSAAAKQASAVLYDNEPEDRPRKLIELGGGASVFPAAFAYFLPTLSVTSIDSSHLIDVAQKTINSIEVQDRWTPEVGNYRHVDLPLNEYDDCVLVNCLKLEADPSAVILLGRCFDTLKPGGRVIVIEPFAEPDFDPVEIATERVTMHMEACPGTIRSTAEIQRLLTGAGFGAAKWGPLDHGPSPIGLLVAKKP